MKVCVLSESPADEAAIRILVEAVLQQPIEPAEARGIRGRGRPNIFASVAPVYKHLHFNTDAEALVVVVDSDYDPLHSDEHEQPGKEDQDCTLCKLRGLVAGAKRGLTSREWMPDLKVALGVAVPAIEAWYLCGRSSDVGEAAWTVSVQAKKFGHVKTHFKKRVYGTDRVTLPKELEFATAEATRVAKDIKQLENLFPQGFGCLVRDIQLWTSS